MIRQSEHTDDLMINLVTFYEDDNLIREYSEALLKTFPQVTTIVNNINLKKAAVAIGDYEKVYYGEGLIYDLIGKYKFRISANSFFQTNTLQAENLYKTALEFAGLNGNEMCMIYIPVQVQLLFIFPVMLKKFTDLKMLNPQ